MFRSTTSVHRCHLVSAFFNCDTCWRQDSLPFVTSSPSSSFVSLAAIAAVNAVAADGRLKTGAHRKRKPLQWRRSTYSKQINTLSKRRETFNNGLRILRPFNTRTNHTRHCCFLFACFTLFSDFSFALPLAHTLILDRIAHSHAFDVVFRFRFFFRAVGQQKCEYHLYACSSLQLIMLWSMSVVQCGFFFRFLRFIRQFQSNPFETDYNFYFFLRRRCRCRFVNSVESDCFFLWNWRSFNRNRDDHCVYFILNEEQAGVCRSRNRQIYVTSGHS